MTFLLLSGAAFALAVVFKAFVLTSKHDQYFQRIWTMGVADFESEKAEIYEQLFSIYNLDFTKKRLETNKLDKLMKDALLFDVKKNHYSKGVYVAPMVQSEVECRMESAEKLRQFKTWSTKVKSKGALIIEQLGM